MRPAPGVLQPGNTEQLEGQSWELRGCSHRLCQQDFWGGWMDGRMDGGVILLPCSARHCELSAAEEGMHLQLQGWLAWGMQSAPSRNEGNFQGGSN